MNDLFMEKLLVCLVWPQGRYLNMWSLLASNSKCIITSCLQDLLFKTYFLGLKTNQDHVEVVYVIFTIQSDQFTNSNYLIAYIFLIKISWQHFKDLYFTEGTCLYQILGNMNFYSIFFEHFFYLQFPN